MLFTLLQNIEQESLRRGVYPVGKEKGAWLHQKIKQLKPRKVLELGTGLGYSGIILGSEGAEVVTIDHHQDLALAAENNFDFFKTTARVIVGDAVTEVRKLAAKTRNQNAFDMIFLDLSGSQYHDMLDDCMKMLKAGGVIIADNTNYVSCLEFKEALKKERRLKTEYIVLDNGISCSTKIFS